MNLAKIRQKARQDREPLLQQPDIPIVAEAKVILEETKSQYVDSDKSSCITDILSLPETEIKTIEKPTFDLQPTVQKAILIETDELFENRYDTKKIPPVRDPMAVILAGRTAAGCYEDLPLASNEIEGGVSQSYLEFLCFRVSDEFYGINIMDIKEIIKPRETTEVPRSPSFVLGVISLRGTIIPIIDMLDRLGLSREVLTGRERVIVVKLKDALSGLLVDEIVQVVRIATDGMEGAPAVLDGIDRDFVSGIGRADGKMIIILNLESIADINLF